MEIPLSFLADAGAGLWIRFPWPRVENAISPQTMPITPPATIRNIEKRLRSFPPLAFSTIPSPGSAPTDDASREGNRRGLHT